MERYSTPFTPLQQDEIPMNFPDFSTYDVGFHQILSPKEPPKVVEKNYVKNKMSCNSQETADARINHELEKKILHREIERERRKEMAALYSSLRSVLPSKSIKGMRSASDQIHEATKYIRYMQNKNRQLEIKRDNTKKSRENEKLGFLREKGSSSKTLLPIIVTVQRCTIGVEILISCGFAAKGRSLSLSGILQLLLEEGLDVVDCNCTKFNGRLHYMIQSEVISCPNIDLQMLQGKLTRSIEKYGDQSA